MRLFWKHMAEIEALQNYILSQYKNEDEKIFFNERKQL